LVTLRPVGDFLAAGGLGDWEIWADGRQRAISRPVGGFEDLAGAGGWLWPVGEFGASQSRDYGPVGPFPGSWWFWRTGGGAGLPVIRCPSQLVSVGRLGPIDI
jgi:hypothetical protein